VVVGVGGVVVGGVVVGGVVVGGVVGGVVGCWWGCWWGCCFENCAAAEDVELRRFYVLVLRMVTYFSSFTLKSALS
jgi:hypothetical protein